ncbi:cation channel sperm-associated auxiliary subunit epsilon-like [Erpetoichthys calabaricus]|uniref:cation channel sperm-associated auxiliary subunit epsilon-like n=1 Tax=Erpetoichthys calabaricus TaxID=27687 RepID=UPI00223461F1|nr:cation channel sperm-associated auxiliary subunit epsilon-like [Erpetoichthys calabaricus]
MFMNCYIAPVTEIFHMHESKKPPAAATKPVYLVVNPSEKLVWHCCYYNKAVLMTDRGSFLTNDGFETREEIKVIFTSDATIKDAAFLGENILFFIDGSIYLLTQEWQLLQLEIDQNLPKNTVKGITSRIRCWKNYPIIGDTLSTVAVWTDTALYLAKENNMNNFTKNVELTLLRSPFDIPEDSIILTVSFASYPAEVAILTGTALNQQLRLIIYNEVTNTSTLTSAFYSTKFEILSGGPINLIFFESTSLSALLWSDNNIYYSYNNNSDYGKMEVIGEPLTSNPVHQVVTDSSMNILVKSTTNRFYHCKYGMTELNQTTGIVSFEIVPSISGITCSLPENRVKYFNIGCPKGRHLRVQRRWELKCERTNLTNYFIPGYDGDTFVKHVDANFVVWEKNGRRDFFYNATMKEVQCLQEAQTWDSMISLTEAFSPDQTDKVWGPHNYRSCFELTPGSFGNLTKPYEILNSSGYNYLTWPKDHNAIYVFIIKILDPNYR